MLGKLGSKTALKPRVKSRSVIKMKLAVIDVQANPKNADLDEILADIPKGEINQNPT